MAKTPVGIQLYSVRDGMQKDFEGTLKKISELGYTSVEFAGFFGRTAEQVNEILNKYNLKVSGTHSSFDDLVNNYEETVAFHKAIGNKYYIIPGYDLWSQEKLDKFVEKVNPICEKLAKEGITLAFHNHYKEFEVLENGEMVYEQLIYRTNLKLEVDTYWAFVGMKNPIGLLERLGDRVIFAHIKDGDVNKNGKPLGLGEAPVKDVVAYVKSKGIPMVVESETCNPSGLEEAEICINYLNSLED